VQNSLCPFFSALSALFQRLQRFKNATHHTRNTQEGDYPKKGDNSMNPIITNYLSELKLGELQIFENMGLIPLLTGTNGGPAYVLLKEALEQKLITIAEVDQAGSVPELKVVNTSPLSILLLDGEELMGAKQNRVLNTSILLKGNSETLIPVSCTERGRWAYTSATFSHSDTIMPHRGRATKMRTVTESLRTEHGYSSDQHRVWADIERLHGEARTSSPTGALRDVYVAKTNELNAYLQAFEWVSHQRGSLVFINGAPVGLDVISRAAAYKVLHPKLVKSYAMDALMQGKDQFDAPSVAKATPFLQQIRACQESKFDSTGQGYDYRFEGPGLVGSALLFAETVIHLAFFTLDQSERGSRMSGYVQRLNFGRGEG
jgi:hypothetical protein